MTTTFRHNVIVTSLWTLSLVMVLTLLQIYMQPGAYRYGNEAITINTATIKHTNTGSIVDDIKLPLRERVSPSTKAEFVITVRVKDKGLTPQYLYIPNYTEKLKAYYNNNVIYDSRLQGHWQGPLSLSSAIIPLPKTATTESDILEIDIKVTADYFNLVRLSEAYVMSETEALARYQSQRFLQRTIKPFLLGAQFFLVVLSLAIFYLRPKDSYYGWLGGLLIFGCLLGLPVLADGMPGALILVPIIVLLAPVGGALLLGFSLCFAARSRPRYLLAATTVLSLICVGFAYSPLIELYKVLYFVSIPIFLIFGVIAVIIMSSSILRDMTFEGLLFFSGLVVLIFGISNDYLNLAGTASAPVTFTQISRTLCLCAIAIFIVRRQVLISTKLDESATNLKLRLAETEEKLRLQYEKEQKLLQRQAIDSERRRLTSDLHDGVAGHLTTILALGDNPKVERSSKSNSKAWELTRQAMTDSARNALVDLRLVLDALSFPEPDLQLALASFRERCVQPLQGTGLDIDWRMDNIDQVSGLTRGHIMNILRILQEAVNNAVRHGEPKQLSIHGTMDRNGQLKLSIVNKGGVWKEQNPSQRSLGLKNMEKRANMLKGHITIYPRADGAEVTLTVPLENYEAE